MTTFLTLIQQAKDENIFDDAFYTSCEKFYSSYISSVKKAGLETDQAEAIFTNLFHLIKKQQLSPYSFECYHQKITAPYDYYSFGLDFSRLLVDKEKSHVYGLDNVKKMADQLSKGENVVLFVNHQTEIDPQLLSLALENSFPQIGSEIIFVAGDRVVTDPMAVPFSLGRNLLCIYSKRHIENPPEKRYEKQLHNQKTMKKMRDLLKEGGKSIYVAPSGGRDRLDAKGEVPVSPFDPQSIEMFRLMAKQAKTPTHFYPLALATYHILPPPHKVEKELGEDRRVSRGGMLFHFGEELDMEHFPGHEIEDRHERRAKLSLHIHQLVEATYNAMKKGKL